MRVPHAALTRVVLLCALAALAESEPAGERRARSIGVRLGRLTESMRDRVLDVVGPDEIVERVDVNAVLERVDVNRLLERVDVNALLTHADVDALLDRVDVDRLLDRVDPNRLLARVDVDAFMERVDVEDIVQRAGIPDVVAQSTSHVAESALNLLRRQLLALDVVLTRAVMRVLGRDVHSLPAGPAALAGDGGPAHSIPVPSAPSTDVTGHYAGAVTRLVAHVLDATIATSLFTFGVGALASVLQAAGVPIAEFDRTGVVFGGFLVVWLFAYWWAATAIAGRTPGMAIVGLRIVTRSGAPLSGRRAFLRVLTLPLSFLLLGAGLLGIVFDRERRGLHDVTAGSTVVYDWGDRRATLPTPLARWLAQRAAPIEPDPGNGAP